MAPPLNQMVPVACWEQPGSVRGPTCGFNYSAWRGDAVERKHRGKQGWPLLFWERGGGIGCEMLYVHLYGSQITGPLCFSLCHPTSFPPSVPTPYIKWGGLWDNLKINPTQTAARDSSRHLFIPFCLFFFVLPPLASIINIPHTRPYIFSCLSSTLTGV